MNKILVGDCLIKLKELEDNSVDSIITDPPYHLVSIVKRFGKESSAPAKEGIDGSFKRLSGGFMGKQWDGVNEDGIGIAQNPELWKECLRVLKPGGHLLAFSGTRTYHRMASAIEDAGFEVRDMIEWVYGSGFPKSLNIGKAVDKLHGNERVITGSEQKAKPTFHSQNVGGEIKEIDNIQLTKGTSEWEGWGTALKPAHEPICMARKPLSEKTVAENCLKYGTGGINIDESRVGTEARFNAPATAGKDTFNCSPGSGTEYQGTTAIGRFPANLIHDNSEEVRECFPETKSGAVKNFTNNGANQPINLGGGMLKPTEGSSGNASRFFKSIIYQAKASKSERNKGCEELEEKAVTEWSSGGFGNENTTATFPKLKNNHPTVKPIALMEYLIKMVTPKGGIVLDPFAGSGSTLVAAKQNGFQYIGIEMTKEYIPIIEARLQAVGNSHTTQELGI